MRPKDIPAEMLFQNNRGESCMYAYVHVYIQDNLRVITDIL
jgi:hypothetical protein